MSQVNIYIYVIVKIRITYLSFFPCLAYLVLFYLFHLPSPHLSLLITVYTHIRGAASFIYIKNNPPPLDGNHVKETKFLVFSFFFSYQRSKLA